MDKIEKIEKDLHGHYWEGNLEAAKVSQPNALLKMKRKSLRTAIIFVSSCLVVSLVSVYSTLYFVNQNKQTGKGETIDGVTYVSHLADYYYPSSIFALSDSKYVYASLYYAFDDASNGIIGLSLNTIVSNDITLKNSSGITFLYSSAPLSNAGIKNSLSFSFSAFITDVSGKTISFINQNIDLTPYYNSAIKN